MRLLLALAVAACGGPSPKPSLHFAGDPLEPATPTADVALTALVNGEIMVTGAWSACETEVPVLAKSDKDETQCARATSVLTVTCDPACATERRGPEQIVVHPPGAGRLVVTATTVRGGSHEKLSETRIYDVVVPEDLGLLCRDIHGHVQECDLPNDRRGTVEVVDWHTPGAHTVEITGGGLTKKTVIAVAPEQP